MATPIQTEIERLRYWQGQKLGSRDFRDQALIEAQLRWWHNRALHNAFGVSRGLQVTRVPDADAFTALSVARGLAYDCYGRELLLQTAREIQRPVTATPPPARMTLLLRYKETAEYLSKKEMMASGAPAACASSPETAVLLWKSSSEVSLSDGVPLARLDYESTANLDSPPALTDFSDTIKSSLRYDDARKLLIYRGVMSPATRDELLNSPSADAAFKQTVGQLFESSQKVPLIDRTFQIIPSRPLSRPRVASGHTSPGNTEWELWTETITSLRGIKSAVEVGMQVTIDTSTAGFTEEPCYFAWLQGRLWTQSNVEFFPVPFQHIDYVSTRRFRFRLWLPRLIGVLGSRARLLNQSFATEFLNFARRQQLSVCWLGIQPTSHVAVEDAPPEEFDCRTSV
jgi:hypothetical protein